MIEFDPIHTLMFIVEHKIVWLSFLVGVGVGYILRDIRERRCGG